MNKSINELLRMVLQHAPKWWHFNTKYSSFYSLVTHLMIKKIINTQEFYVIRLYIFENIPVESVNWKPYRWSLRRKWLKEQIELTKKPDYIHEG